jgi:hydrogenase-4 component F
MASLTPLLVYSIVLMPLLALVVAFVFRRNARLINLSTILFSFLSLLASILVAPEIPKRAPAYGSLLYLDSLSIYFVLLVNLVAFLASIYTIPFLKFDRQRNPNHDPGWFHAFLNLFHFTMLMVPMVDNLVVLWIAVELTTIFSTVLVRYQRSRLAIEASWKFMMITTTGIIFALLGTLFLTNALPKDPLIMAATMPPEFVAKISTGAAMSWSAMAKPEVASHLEPNFVMLSFLFVMIGYGTKAGLAPMHTWLPDGHGEAPSPVSALLSGVMLKSAMYAILRFYTITNLTLQETVYAPFASFLLIATGLFSLALATPFIIKKNKFKRVLAYHSLEHMGIIAFGIGVGTPVALFGALLHTLNHALTKALMFLMYGTIQYEYLSRTSTGPVTEKDEMAISGVLKSMPFSGTILGFGGLALVGSPPFSIFMSEFIILWAAIQNAFLPEQNGYLTILKIASIVLFVVTVTMIFGGLVGHLARLLLGRSPFKAIEPNFSLSSLGLAAPFMFLILLLLVFGIAVPAWPVNFPMLLKNSIAILQNGAVANP